MYNFPWTWLTLSRFAELSVILWALRELWWLAVCLQCLKLVCGVLRGTWTVLSQSVGSLVGPDLLSVSHETLSVIHDLLKVWIASWRMPGASVSLWSPQSFCGAPGILWDSPSTRIALSQFLGLSSLDGPIFSLGLSFTVQSIAAENRFQGYATIHYVCAM